ncbi:MAG: FecR domain-containing protein [Planctomycetes bacterium]|nr:FecR domain-containing protein [Planctomycetota bacterium]
MSPQRPLPADFAEWIVRSLDGTITPEQFAQLDQEIASNDRARAYYLEFVTTYVGLMALMGGLPAAQTLVGAAEPETGPGTAPPVVEIPAPGRPARQDRGDLRVGPDSSEQDRIREIERLANRQLAEFLARERQTESPASRPAGWDWWSALCEAAQTGQRFMAVGARMVKAAVVCLVILGVLSIVGLYVYSHRTLGLLMDAAHAKWDVPLEPTGKLRAGRITLEEGYARIRLNKGAEVLLQAPSTFDLRSTNRMFLESGWITARVPPAASGFTVRTPVSSIVDFGTEFGLLAGESGNTEVHVFDGRIEFEHAGGADTARTRQKLTRDEAVTVDAAGHARRVPVLERPRLFSRVLPAAESFGLPGKRLGLADMVGAGNGLDTGIWGQGLDASTGQIASRRTILKKNDNGFTAVPALPFIDGVFVPDSSDGSAIVTSTGLSFAPCPKTSGTSYEAIVYGASFQVGSAGEIHYGRLAGRTYDTRSHPSIGMHPNAGITFDLDAIRSAMPETVIRRFQARCGVSENVVRFAERDADPAAIQVTFWVLVDGQPQFSRTLGVVPAQAEPIDVPIHPGNRFLTLATTTPGEYRYCWALFAEPALELTRRKP